MAKPAFKPNKVRPSKDLALAIARGEPLPEERDLSSSHAQPEAVVPTIAPIKKKSVKAGKTVSLNMQVSQATWQAISYKSIEEGISRKLLIMQVLQAAGIDVDAADLAGFTKGKSNE
ncbi:hypothetical protein [Acetobacter persici]|uniref:hypothetical protein n=1 Tax=Acetobacter persici TaxID=1076596 RepID=UPI0011789AF7|nr:hypothetical protein [Acetobacter persici]